MHGQRLIYIFLLIVLAVPIVLKSALPPVRMNSAEKLYKVVEDLNPSKGFAFVAVDFGPSTIAENQPQAEVVIEHLFRRKVPVVVFTMYALGERFSIDVPRKVAARLNKELGSEELQYGKDWISLGYRAGSALFLQALAKSDDIVKFLGKDVTGRAIISFERFAQLKSLSDISLVAEFTGLMGLLDGYIQFLQKSDYIPPLVHGCTSITIPETYIYMDSGQLKGSLEGIAGAAWYSKLLKDRSPDRPIDAALILNTSLGVGHLAIIFLIALGNLLYFFGPKAKEAV